jgi:hypothetical protein
MEFLDINLTKDSSLLLHAKNAIQEFHLRAGGLKKIDKIDEDNRP